jgi:hypothetical protein
MDFRLLLASNGAGDHQRARERTWVNRGSLPSSSLVPAIFSRPDALVVFFILKIIDHLSRSLQLFFWWACEESFTLWRSICFEQLLVDPLKQFVRDGGWLYCFLY